MSTEFEAKYKNIHPNQFVTILLTLWVDLRFQVRESHEFDPLPPVDLNFIYNCAQRVAYINSTLRSGKKASMYDVHRDGQALVFGMFFRPDGDQGPVKWSTYFCYSPADQFMKYGSDFEHSFDHFVSIIDQLLDETCSDYSPEGTVLNADGEGYRKNIRIILGDLVNPALLGYKASPHPEALLFRTPNRPPTLLGKSSPEFCCNLINQAIEAGHEVWWQPPDKNQLVLLSRVSLARDDGWFYKFESIIRDHPSIPEGSRATWLVSADKVREFVDTLLASPSFSHSFSSERRSRLWQS